MRKRKEKKVKLKKKKFGFFGLGVRKKKAMHVTIVRVQVKPEHIQDFIEASRLNHAGSMREAGNRRFDVLQRADDPTEFVLYEAYASAEEATAAHNIAPPHAFP